MVISTELKVDKMHQIRQNYQRNTIDVKIRGVLRQKVYEMSFVMKVGNTLFKN